jgi:hypothetical protein
MDPARRAVVERRDAWLEAVRKGTFSDEVFYLGPKGEFEPVLVSAIPLSDPLLAEAWKAFPQDERLKKKIASWTQGGRSAVLVGYYARNLKSGRDFLKDSPFAAKLSIPGLAPLSPDSAEMVDRSFLGDYFPVFSRWHRIVAYSFKTGLGPSSVLSVSWPTGSREISLRPDPTTEASR